MSSKLFKGAVRREIRARRDLVGTVVSQRELREFNTLSAPVWVCDVDIGSNRLLRNVPIKGAETGQRFFAERGQAVLLRRNSQGRYDIVGPSDKLAGVAVKKTYAVGVTTVVATTNEGFNVVPEPFEFYQGPTPPTVFTSLWNDGSTPFPLVRILDAETGLPV